jgi:hypothetical protein
VRKQLTLSNVWYISKGRYIGEGRYFRRNTVCLLFVNAKNTQLFLAIQASANFKNCILFLWFFSEITRIFANVKNCTLFGDYSAFANVNKCALSVNAKKAHILGVCPDFCKH